MAFLSIICTNNDIFHLNPRRKIALSFLLQFYSLTLERQRFQTTYNDQVGQLTHNVDKLQFVLLFGKVNILEVEMLFAAP